MFFLITVIAAVLIGSNAVLPLHAKQNLIFSADRISNENSPEQNETRLETIFWSEDFESTIDWTSYDATLTDAEWHLLDAEISYEDLSWWMGDPYIGGYLDHVYVVLDTDPILVPENGHLTFKLNYNCEPAGSDDSTPLYNGWDGSNVRISTDGETWNVLNGLPAYTASSLYSFGVEHGEGANIPGWTGSSDGWIDADFDLSAYSGQNVQIRFAFASDPATNTQDNGNFFGMMIDNIELGSFVNHGFAAGMTPGNMVEGGGDHWHQVTPGYFSDTAISCDDAGAVGDNWYNYYESPSFILDDEGEYTLDLALKGEFDPTSYWGCEIAYRVGTYWSNWYNVTNPLNQPEIDTQVFGAPGTEWAMASDLYSAFPVDLTDIGGHYIKLRVYLKSFSPASGTGLVIDDFIITETIYPSDPPTNLQAELNSDHTVNLSWDQIDIPEVTGYNIYRLDNAEYQLLGSTTDLVYTDFDPIYEFTAQYAVTAIFDGDETDYSESVMIFIPAETANWLIVDDGSAESAFGAGQLNSAAVTFTTDQNYLTHLQIYISELNVGDMNLKAWDIDANGSPNNEISNFYVSAEELSLGWNFINIPEVDRPELTSGSFAVGFFQLANSNLIGLDEDSSGNSLQKIDGTWEMTTGNLMIRALVDDDELSVDDDSVPQIDFALSNYPNPFNPSGAGRSPTTTINFSLADNVGKATVEVYNTKGQKVKTLLNDKLTAGQHQVIWNGKDANQKSVASGIYFYRLSIDNVPVAIQKMILLK